MRGIIALLLLVSTASAQTVERFYDAHGNPRGQAYRSGKRTYILDQNGNRHGWYEQQEGRTVFYDNNGNRRGSAERPH